VSHGQLADTNCGSRLRHGKPSPYTAAYMGATCCRESASNNHISQGLSKEQLVKVYPLLCDLEADFQRFASQDGTLDRKNLARLWIATAERKVGMLSEEEKSLIVLSSDKFHQTADIDGNGKVSYIEFQTFMRGGFEERAELHQMRDRLALAVKRNPAVLAHLIKLFNVLDKNGDGFVTKEEIKESLEGSEIQKFPEFRAKKQPGPLAKRKNKATSKDDIDAKKGLLGHIDLEMLLEGADVNGDGRVDLWEFIAYAMGRRKAPVELLLYDISDGLSKRVSWALLGREFEAIYHSSVLVFGFEYWYGGRVFKTRPPCTRCFGNPLAESAAAPLQQSSYMPELMSVHLGYTLATADEFKNFLGKNLAKKYRRDNYDVLTHNCNGFSNEVVGYLTGSMIPEEVLNLPELVMATTTAKFLRPLLNRWLGGFGNSTNDHDSIEDATTTETEEEEELMRCQATAAHADADLADGGFVLAEGLPGLTNGEQVVCRVVKESAYRVDLSYFDPKTEEITTRKNLNKTVIKSRLERQDLPTTPSPISTHQLQKMQQKKGMCFFIPCKKY